MRVLMLTERIADGEVVATPDAANVGFRVKRYARCGFNGADERTYVFRKAGVPEDVQWLMTAAHGDAFLVTALL